MSTAKSDYDPTAMTTQERSRRKSDHDATAMTITASQVRRYRSRAVIAVASLSLFVLDKGVL